MRVLTFFLVVGVVAGGALLFVHPELLRGTLPQKYISNQYGLSFGYPLAYTLQELDPVSNGPTHHVILLSSKTNTPVPKNSDGAPGISIDIYGSDSGAHELENWVRGSSASNFTYSVDGSLYSATVAGQPAFFYRWDGLYRSDTYAVSNRDSVILFTVSYNSPDDQIHKDFMNIVGSVHLR